MSNSPQGPSRFPPGEVGARFNSIGELSLGDIVYIRAEYRGIGETGFAVVRLRDPDRYEWGFNQVMLPKSQIVCREPAAMEADNGIVRGIE